LYKNTQRGDARSWATRRGGRPNPADGSSMIVTQRQ
jgi:hypothetical protein